ncbi:Uncharacterized protein PRO82_000727 [Candidatus Protochlamydia amoebophila]|nr:Uncharacterized protein [Candidatus Protochlamydia amoebophila]
MVDRKKLFSGNRLRVGFADRCCFAMISVPKHVIMKQKRKKIKYKRLINMWAENVITKIGP